jgi:hypothetical protein
MPEFALNSQYTWYHVFMLIKEWLQKILSWAGKLLWILVFLFFAARSSISLNDPLDQVRRYTRQDEFEFVGWTLNALSVKIGQFSLGVSSRLREEQRVELVLEYFEDLRQARQLEQKLEILLADPARSDHDEDAQSIRSSLQELRSELDQIQPFVEAILQEQVAYILSEAGLGAGGIIFPPVSFKFTEPPLALIVSPRDEIRVDANVQLNPSLTLDQRIALEDQVAEDLNVSSLVVNIGGIGIYPTMILESTSLRWIVETIVHEWVHNYLTLRPLGLNYETSADLRTMNETVASLLGEELGYQVLAHYYPEFAPEREVVPPASTSPSSEPPAFEFRAEMHKTRISVDEFLAQGLVEEAEAYMEERRQVFWDNGYRLRKLNQAYFAFHGAYADAPQGAAGEDPVGDAVRRFWEKVNSPVEFLFRMSWMNDFSDLENALQRLSTTP